MDLRHFANRFLAGFVLFISLIMQLESASAAGILGRHDLQRLFPGKFDVIVKENRVTMIANADGTLIGKVWGSKDEGRWYVSGTKLCIRLENWMKGKTRCSSVTEDQGWYEGSGVRFRKL